MARCSKCGLFSHNVTAHRQVCAICGGGAVIKDRADDVDPGWRCDNVALHERIRQGFGDPEMVKEAKSPLPTAASLIEKPLKGQTRLKVVE